VIERPQLQGDAASALCHPHRLEGSARRLRDIMVARLLLPEREKYGEARAGTGACDERALVGQLKSIRT